MKAFRFSLETLLRVRRLREEQARLDLAQVVQALNRNRRAVAEAETRRTQVAQTWPPPAGPAVRGQDYQMAQRYLVALKRTIDDLKQHIARQEEEVREKQLKLQKLLQERKVLEMLREKKYAQYRWEQARLVQNEADENALLRLGR